MSTTSIPSTQTQPIPLDLRRNVGSFTADIFCFISATYFIPVTTVLAGLTSELTKDKALIGAVGTAWLAVWYLPQLFGARIVHGKTYQKKYVMISTLIGKQMFLLFALWLAFTRAQQPTLTVWLLLAAIVIFNLCDALAGIAWFDILSRTLSPRIRGRVVVGGQLAASIVGIGASEITKRLLNPAVLAFPLNYAAVFGLAWVLFTFSTIALTFIKEIPMLEPATQEAKPSFMHSLREVMTNDPVFRQALWARLLTGAETMAAAFYIVFIKEQLKLGDDAIGTFTQILIFGAMGGLLLFGWLSEKFGPRRVIHAASALQFISPLLAFLMAILSPSLLGSSAGFVVMAIAVAMRGAIEHSLVLGFVGYLLDYAPPRSRGIYVGVMNTVGGIISLAPVLGGLLIDALLPIGSPTAYAAVFGLSALLVGVGLVLVLRLPKLNPHKDSQLAQA